MPSSDFCQALQMFRRSKGSSRKPETISNARPQIKAPLAALIFKVSMAEGRKLSFVRIYSGKIKAGDDVFNPFRNKKEKLSRILQMHANKRERIEEAGAGSIVGVIGLEGFFNRRNALSAGSPHSSGKNGVL